MPDVSVVITTYQRPDACERALVSVLEQEPAPLEILICDHGSTDDTPARFRAWETRNALVRYVRVEPNRGTPAPTRNRGVAEARAEWVAFLDDDDRWVPGKLAAQLAVLHEADLIASNARTTEGVPYFPDLSEDWRPSRADLLTANPVITSSAMVRRAPLLAVGGFPETRHLEDYAAWLALADIGARFLILHKSLVLYTAHAGDRFGARPLRGDIAIARHAWRRVLADPRDPSLIRAALNRTAGAVRVAAKVATRRYPRSSNDVPPS